MPQEGPKSTPKKAPRNTHRPIPSGSRACFSVFASEAFMASRTARKRGHCENTRATKSGRPSDASLGKGAS
eukprot:2990017-Pyramimonas_sp.AAC.1